jgi:pyruvate, water dikinase
MGKRDTDVIWFEDLTIGDVGIVGGKNASLGEMVRELAPKGIEVPPGFATSADAFRRYITANALDGTIAAAMDRLGSGKATLQETGSRIRQSILDGDWPEDTEAAIRAAYAELAARTGKTEPSVAVRSSATAEDLPDASFAGQQETFLNVVGIGQLLDTCRRCYASLFTDRAITYRQLKGFDWSQVALSVGVQLMARSDLWGSGVMFSIDTESGFDRAVLINAAWGLGENVVQGAVNPDEYMVYKPFLSRPGLVPVIEKTLGAKEKKMIYAGDGRMTKNVPSSKKERASFVLEDPEIVELARMAATIEAHYGKPMDMEWAKDGETGRLYIVQARPETVQSRADQGAIRSYRVTGKGPVLLRGLSVGDAAVSGRVCLIEHARDIDRFVEGSILVTGTTDPDWVPIMKKAAAIITDHGGRTSHAAIVSRELGLPAIVGTGTATHVLHDEQEVTVDCAGGEEGEITAGAATIEVEALDLSHIPDTRTGVMLNLANPAAALRWWRLPAAGVGLARMEFVVNSAVRIHPMALVHFDDLADAAAKEQIEALTAGYTDKSQYFVDTLARGLSRIAAVHYPQPGHHPDERLQDQRIRRTPRRARLRAEGGEPDDRVPWRLALLLAPLPRGLRAGMPGDPEAAGGDGLRQRGRDDPLLPHARGGGPGARGHGGKRAHPRGRRTSGLRHVRDPVERDPRFRIREALRRLLHRLERPHPAHPRHRPRQRGACRALPRGSPRRPVDDRDRDPRGAQGGRQGGILRAGAVERPRLRAKARGLRDRHDLGHARRLPRRSRPMSRRPKAPDPLRGRAGSATRAPAPGAPAHGDHRLDRSRPDPRRSRHAGLVHRLRGAGPARRPVRRGAEGAAPEDRGAQPRRARLSRGSVSRRSS